MYVMMVNEYDIFENTDGHRKRGLLKRAELCDLTKRGHRVNEMMAVAVTNFAYF